MSDVCSEIDAQAVVEEIRRECRRCGKSKPLDVFVINRTCVGGRERICKGCASVRTREIRDARKAELVVSAVQGGYEICSAKALHQLAAACLRWSECEDGAEREGAADAAIYRARQLLIAVEAEA
jgi:hypothetical protein